MSSYYDTPSLPFADGFAYKNGELFCGNVCLLNAVSELATPCYLYNIDAIVDKYARYAGAFASLNHRTFYAVKANSNISLLKRLAEAGCGMDVNSAGELFRALKAGVDPSKITMTGVGKSERDIRSALAAGILYLNAESQEECLRINAIALDMGLKANIVLRINPDVNAATHPYIATGLAEHKFGLGLEEAQSAIQAIAGLEAVELVGFGMHLGSQIFTVSPYKEGLEKLVDFAVAARGQYGFDIRYINIGGGMGVSYDETEQAFPLDELSGAISSILAARGLDITAVSEPGRYLVANAGVLLARVAYVKKNAGKTFVIIDAGMNDLIRPALYQAEHIVLPLTIRKNTGTMKVDVVGPVCESGDTFLTDYILPEVEPGQPVAIFSTGAYGAAMSSRYNSRPFAAEYGLIHGQISQIRKAESFDDMIRLEL